MIKILQPCFVRIFSFAENKWFDYSAEEGEIFPEDKIHDFFDLIEGEDYVRL